MTICTAIQEKRLVSFSYDGHSRVVVPAAHGPHKTTGNSVFRGYQIRGTSGSRAVPLWDLFLEDKAVGLTVLDETFDENPPGYRPGDKHIRIHCEL